MQADREAGAFPLPRDHLDATELFDLRAACARQRNELMTLRETAALFRKGVHRLGVENDRLRVVIDVMRALDHARDQPDERRRTEIELEPGEHAPAAASTLVTDFLRDHVPSRVLARARSIASELTTDSVRDGDPRSDRRLVLRIESSPSVIRLEVESPDGLGDGGTRRPGQQRLQTYSDRWGGERTAFGGTLLWAEIAVTTATA
jgi:hypothetical protein